MRPRKSCHRHYRRCPVPVGDKLWVTWVDIPYGIRLFYAMHPDYVFPVGIVCGMAARGQHRTDTFHVMWSYTLPFMRRRGVRTRINQDIAKYFDIVHTWSGSATGGSQFMRAQGYTFDKQRQDWFLKCRNKVRSGSSHR